MSKHTPGPWEVMDSFYPSIKEVVGPSFNVKAVMWATDLTEKDYQERSADLRLIAAAPDLLDALKNLVVQYGIVHDIGDMEMQPAIDFAYRAIARATGEQA